MRLYKNTFIGCGFSLFALLLYVGSVWAKPSRTEPRSAAKQNKTKESKPNKKAKPKTRSKQLMPVPSTKNSKRHTRPKARSKQFVPVPLMKKGKRYKRVKRKRKVRRTVIKANSKVMASLKKKWPGTLLVRVAKKAKAKVGKLGKAGEKEMHLISHFLLDHTEVSVAAYRACVKAGKCSLPSSKGKYCNYGKPGRGDHPVNCVNWHQAKRFCQWQGKRLPTAKEWRWAAQGASDRMYPWGSQKPTCERAVFRGQGKAGCDRDRTWPVGSLPAGNSPFGMTNMAGNVKEWVADCAQANPRGQCTHRKILGGSWQSMAISLAIQAEMFAKPETQGPLTGFRCAADAPANLMIAVEEMVEVEEEALVAIPSAHPVVHTYSLSIPEVLIAPCDSQCKNWDRLGGLPQFKLLAYRRAFRKQMKDASNRYCWKAGSKWTCGSKEKSLFRLLKVANFLMTTYQKIHSFARTRGYFRPDPQVIVKARGQTLTFKKRSDTFAPSWSKGQRLRLAFGDKVTVAIYDRDPLFRKSLITRFSFRFTPPPQAQTAKASRYIHNSTTYAKNIVFQLVRK